MKDISNQPSKREDLAGDAQRAGKKKKALVEKRKKEDRRGEV